jgi:alcohol dehydrogenase
LVSKGIDICRKENIDLILAVGGGSVIDSAKAISMGVHYKGDVWDFFEGKGILNRTVPLAAVLTLSGSGSEASKYTVITNEQNFQKTGFGSDQIRPKFAILNPELTYSVPKDHTAAGVVDIISHILERYFGKVSHADINDRLIEVTIKTVIKNALRLIDVPDDYHARSEIMWASTIAQNDMMGLGRISDFEMHKIEHELSAFYDISHGAGLAIITPAWMRYVYKKNTNKFKELFSYIFQMDMGGKDLEGNILKGIARLEDFFKKIGMPVRLKELDISEERFEEIASRCVSSGPIGKTASLGYKDILNILELAK